MAGWRLRPAALAGLKRSRVGKPLSPSDEVGDPAHGGADLFPGTARNGNGSPGASTSAKRAGHPAQRRRPDRAGPARDRRRHLGQAAVGRAQPRGRRPAPRSPRPGTSTRWRLVRAITLTWLFSGQRSDEIARLRVGCVRWQHDGTPIASGSDQVLARDVVCLLDVPTHKTGTAFTKPVDPLLGQAIEAWQAVRPAQPKFTDRRTGELVDLLFGLPRPERVAKHYINEMIIPVLCAKAGVPAADVRGKITSHRARSTIASQLYNAKEPMTLFELQAWLGHASPETTQHYAKITPNTLTRAYKDAGYFERNVRTIEVLIDRDAVASGQAEAGEPWQHYDLGHGLCSYTFFEQCQHRMACAKCDFYIPKNSAEGADPRGQGELAEDAGDDPAD